MVSPMPAFFLRRSIRSATGGADGSTTWEGGSDLAMVSSGTSVESATGESMVSGSTVGSGTRLFSTLFTVMM